MLAEEPLETHPLFSHPCQLKIEVWIPMRPRRLCQQKKIKIFLLLLLGKMLFKSNRKIICWLLEKKYLFYEQTRNKKTNNDFMVQENYRYHNILLLLKTFCGTIFIIFCGIISNQPPSVYQNNEKILLDEANLANQLMLTDPNLNFQLNSLAKPNWPRSAPTIPCTFYKSQNEKVYLILSSNSFLPMLFNRMLKYWFLFELSNSYL